MMRKSLQLTPRANMKKASTNPPNDYIGNVEMGISSIDNLPDSLEYKIENYTLKEKICNDNGIKMVIENTNIPEYMKKTYLDLSKENFRFNYDIGHDNNDKDMLYNILKEDETLNGKPANVEKVKRLLKENGISAKCYQEMMFSLPVTFGENEEVKSYILITINKKTAARLGGVFYSKCLFFIKFFICKNEIILQIFNNYLLFYIKSYKII